MITRHPVLLIQNRMLPMIFAVPYETMESPLSKIARHFAVVQRFQISWTDLILTTVGDQWFIYDLNSKVLCTRVSK